MKEHGLVFPTALFLFQVVMVILFAFFVTYDSTYKYKTPGGENGTMKNGTNEPLKAQDFYTTFQDVHVMVFLGIGFLMTFLKKYGFGAVSYNLLLAGMCLQWATLINAWVRQRISKEAHPTRWRHDLITGEEFSPGTIRIGYLDVLTSDITCAAVLISFGVLLGKTSRIQLLLIVIFETIFYAVNENILVDIVGIRDVGGSIIVHLFGAYFGMAVSLVIQNGIHGHDDEESNYHSDLFAMIGTIFLWVFWPSFNSGPVSNQPYFQRVAIVNTYFAMGSCVVAVFVMSSLVEKKFRLNMIHIQNATLAGGVAVGASADLFIKPWGSSLIGFLAGILSVLGITYVSPWILKKLKIHDTCGVHNLHGIPSVFAGLCASVACAILPVQAGLYGLVDDGKRALTQQAGFQFLGVVVSFGIAVVGGLITGLIIKPFNRPQEEFYNDNPDWLVPEMVGQETTAERMQGKTNPMAMVMEEVAFVPPSKVGD